MKRVDPKETQVEFVDKLQHPAKAWSIQHSPLISTVEDDEVEVEDEGEMVAGDELTPGN